MRKLAEPRVTTTVRHLPNGGAEVTYSLAHCVASPLLMITLAAMMMMPLVILWNGWRFAEYFGTQTITHILTAIVVFAFCCYWVRQIVWAFPHRELIFADGALLTITRRLCGVRVTRRFELRPGALGVQFETSWSSSQKPRYRLHYELGRQKCDFAMGLSEQSARELLQQLTQSNTCDQSRADMVSPV